MSEFTKVNIRKELMAKIKARAAAQNRTITNYIETVILKDLNE